MSEHPFKSGSDYARTDDVYEGGQQMIPKFRAWDEPNKIMRSNDEIVMWSGQVYINEKKELDSKIKGFSCLPKHLMQSTGLKDKNSVEIFEGDVVRSFSNINRISAPHLTKTIEPTYNNKIVIYSNGAFVLSDDGKREYAGVLNHCAGAMAKDLEVIGNIYENSDLLEAE
ncbi:YopX family protein [Enterococcus thailandicus]